MKLIEQNKLTITVTDASGKSSSSAHGFCVDFRPTAHGFAAYINGSCKAGLSGENSIVITPENGVNAIAYVAINNTSPFWCSPFFGSRLCDLPKKVQLLLTQDNGLWHCVLPVCADTFKTLLRGGENGMEIVTYSDCTGLCECRDQLAFIYETGEEPFALLHSCAKTAAALLGNGLKMRQERKLDDIFEYFGWCSWDAVQIWVSEKGLADKAKEFNDQNVPIHFAIIDDFWGNAKHLDTAEQGMDFGDMINIMHETTLDRFEGRPGYFPNGMKGAVDALKAAGVAHVGVWFPTTGYWNGYTHNGPDAKALGEHMFLSQQRLWASVDPPAGGTLVVKPTKEDAAAYFTELCSRVKSWGADFVKIDNQGSYVYYKDTAPVGQAAQSIQYGIEKSTHDVFGGALINCMGMPSECMFHRPDSALSRCSNDFMPESREWFA